MKLLFQVSYHVSSDQLSSLFVIDIGKLVVGAGDESLAMKIDHCRRWLRNRAEVYNIVYLGEIYSGIHLLPYADLEKGD